MATNTSTTFTYTINVYGRNKAEDKVYGTNDRKATYDTRNFWISEGFTAIVTDPFLPR